MSFSIKVAMTYSPTKLHGGQVRRWRQQLVTRSIAESDAAWCATGNRGRHRQERRLSAPVYAKKGHPLEMSFSIKVAMTYSPTNVCSTIGAVGLNFSVRNGKRWIPDAINRLNMCTVHLYNTLQEKEYES